jgi:hypothetical protein
MRYDLSTIPQLLPQCGESELMKSLHMKFPFQSVGMNVESVNHNLLQQVKKDDTDFTVGNVDNPNPNHAEHQLEVEAELNPTGLYRLMRERRWDYAIQRLEVAPMEAQIWLSHYHHHHVSSSSNSKSSSPKSSSNSNSNSNSNSKKGSRRLLWRALPLHIACNSDTPSVALIEALLKVYPQACREVDHLGCLPLHNVCREVIMVGGDEAEGDAASKAQKEQQRDIQTLVERLLEVHPDALYVHDLDGLTPMKLVTDHIREEGHCRISKLLVKLLSRKHAALTAERAARQQSESQQEQPLSFIGSTFGNCTEADDVTDGTTKPPPQSLLASSLGQCGDVAQWDDNPHVVVASGAGSDLGRNARDLMLIAESRVDVDVADSNSLLMQQSGTMTDNDNDDDDDDDDDGTSTKRSKTRTKNRNSDERRDSSNSSSNSNSSLVNDESDESEKSSRQSKSHSSLQLQRQQRQLQLHKRRKSAVQLDPALALEDEIEVVAGASYAGTSTSQSNSQTTNSNSKNSNSNSNSNKAVIAKTQLLTSLKEEHEGTAALAVAAVAPTATIPATAIAITPELPMTTTMTEQQMMVLAASASEYDDSDQDIDMLFGLTRDEDDSDDEEQAMEEAKANGLDNRNHNHHSQSLQLDQVLSQHPKQSQLQPQPQPHQLIAQLQPPVMYTSKQMQGILPQPVPVALQEQNSLLLQRLLALEQKFLESQSQSQSPSLTLQVPSQSPRQQQQQQQQGRQRQSPPSNTHNNMQSNKNENKETMTTVISMAYPPGADTAQFESSEMSYNHYNDNNRGGEEEQEAAVYGALQSQQVVPLRDHEHAHAPSPSLRNKSRRRRKGSSESSSMAPSMFDEHSQSQSQSQSQSPSCNTESDHIFFALNEELALRQMHLKGAALREEALRTQLRRLQDELSHKDQMHGDQTRRVQFLEQQHDALLQTVQEQTLKEHTSTAAMAKVETNYKATIDQSTAALAKVETDLTNEQEARRFEAQTHLASQLVWDAEQIQMTSKLAALELALGEKEATLANHTQLQTLEDNRIATLTNAKTELEQKCVLLMSDVVDQRAKFQKNLARAVGKKQELLDDMTKKMNAVEEQSLQATQDSTLKHEILKAEREISLKENSLLRTKLKELAKQMTQCQVQLDRLELDAAAAEEEES